MSIGVRENGETVMRLESAEQMVVDIDIHGVSDCVCLSHTFHRQVRDLWCRIPPIPQPTEWFSPWDSWCCTRLWGLEVWGSCPRLWHLGMLAHLQVLLWLHDSLSICPGIYIIHQYIYLYPLTSSSMRRSTAKSCSESFHCLTPW